MRLAVLFLVSALATGSAQDTSFSQLRLRGSVLRNPVIGQIRDDWKPRTGGQFEIAANVGWGDLGLAVGYLGYDATTGKPPFTATLFTLAWTAPAVRVAGAELSAGVRLTDLKMEFDDPSIVEGLRTEEEILLGAIARARVPLGRTYSAFIDGSYGVLMLHTKTPVVLVHAGIERTLRTPDWLRDILR